MPLSPGAERIAAGERWDVIHQGKERLAMAVPGLDWNARLQIVADMNVAIEALQAEYEAMVRVVEAARMINDWWRAGTNEDFDAAIDALASAFDRGEA